VTRGHEGIVTSLLGAGAMLEVKDARGQTPLHIAAANGQDAILQLLFVRGANINAIM
jgi:ankyrin repeat protein